VLARRWGSHGEVTALISAVNVLWLLPWSVLAMKFPAHAIVWVVAALGPLTLLAALLGSGRSESTT
jgi:Fuc2NAc and GlcNAc transferase